MPIFQYDGVSIHFEEYGEGFPLLLFAPGGMHSVAQMWSERPDAPGEPMPWIDPTVALAGEFRVIAMDQRNAGTSTGPVSGSDGWDTYAADHLALLDHLGHEQVNVMGGCIGSSYALGMCKAAPGRVNAAVLQNPIGLTEDNRGDFVAMFDGWASELQRRRTDITEEAVSGFRHNMFGGDFVFSVDRDFVRNCDVPLLVLAGSDKFHPHAVAEEITGLAPSAQLVTDWAGVDRYEATGDRIRTFLSEHTPRD